MEESPFLVGHLVSEEVSAGNVSPAMFGLQDLTLGAPPTARTAHHPDHGGQGLLDLEILCVCLSSEDAD